MRLKELKRKSPDELLTLAEEHGVENAGSMLKQDIIFAILKKAADSGVAIIGEGTIELLQDGFGFLRSPEANYLAGPDDIYVSPSQVRRFGLRTGDTVDGEIRGPKDGERYFALLKVNTINFDPPDTIRHKINFDNLTPLYPDRRIRLEVEVPVTKAAPAAAAIKLTPKETPKETDIRWKIRCSARSAPIVSSRIIKATTICRCA
jgi:transcription termination factor Rho